MCADVLFESFRLHHDRKTVTPCMWRRKSEFECFHTRMRQGCRALSAFKIFDMEVSVSFWVMVQLNSILLWWQKLMSSGQVVINSFITQLQACQWKTARAPIPSGTSAASMVINIFKFSSLRHRWSADLLVMKFFYTKYAEPRALLNQIFAKRTVFSVLLRLNEIPNKILKN